MLTLVADELIATMGGYGYVEEYPAERYYRDARINRCLLYTSPSDGAISFNSSTTSSGIRRLITVIGRSFLNRSCILSLAVFIRPPFLRSGWPR